jgi:hypothetical protein
MRCAEFMIFNEVFIKRAKGMTRRRILVINIGI